MEFFLCNKRKIAVKPTIHQKSAVSKALLRKFQNQRSIVCTPSLPPISAGMGLAYNQIVKKEGLDRILIFRGGCLERGGGG